jgi:MoaA/NifB/PqqE/SkfB family radical SAM enzyme
MTEKIISVEPAVPMIALSWMIGARCNYECVYCPAELHDKTSKHPDIEQLKQVWNNFYNKTKHLGLPYRVSFTGGEVTANKSFLPLIKYLRNNEFNISKIFVISNGSASLKYYQQLSNLVNGLSFSTHSEFFNEKEFFTKVKKINALMIRPEKSLHVNIMDEWWNQDRIELYKQWLTENNISHSVNLINFSNRHNVILSTKGVKNIEQL